MNNLSSIPNVNLHFLNALQSEDLNSLLILEFRNLLERIFPLEVVCLEVEIVRLTENNFLPYVFYIGHEKCAVDVSIPFEKLAVSLPIRADRMTANSTKVPSLFEEHLALQGVSILRDLLFGQENTTFQGRSVEERGPNCDCVSLKLTTVQEKIELVCRFNFFIPPNLELSGDKIKEIKVPRSFGLPETELASLEPVPVSVFLGVLNINPSSLIEMLTAGNRIGLPDDLSLEKCIFKIGDECFGTGKLVENLSGRIFIFGEKAKVDLFSDSPGFSSIFLRIYSGFIETAKLGLNYPYYPLRMKWYGE